MSRHVCKSEREASVLEKLKGIALSEHTQNGFTPAKATTSEWEKLARERSIQEQAMLKEDREKLRNTLHSLDSSVAITVQKNLEIFATAIAQMRQDAVEIRRVTDEARLLTSRLDDLENLQMASQMKLQNEVNELKNQFKLLKEDTSVGYVVPDSMEQQSTQSAICLLGGYDGQSWLKSVQTFSPKTSKLEFGLPMLEIRAYAAASTLEGYIYLFGGGDGKSWFNSVDCYDHYNECWLECSPMGLRRGSLGGATVGDRIFAVGGGNGKTQFSEVECFDANLGTWIPSTNMLERRFMVAAAELDGALYACGGFDGKQYLKSVERFDPREALWTRVASMNSKRGSLCASVLNEKLYAIGGYDGSKYLNSVEMFDPRANNWAVVESMSSARAYGAAVSYDNGIYVMGGLSGSDSNLCEYMEVYKEGKGCWSKVCSCYEGLEKRSFLTAAVLEF